MAHSIIKRLLKISVFFLILVIGSCIDNSRTLFKEHLPKESGIGFSNTLDLGGDLAVLEFEYMYNGAGVAVADFDHDGFQDIFFTGNMVSNRLYRNLGDWRFEDITNTAKVGSDKWSNGVAIVDINQDGYQDIYVCRGGPRGSSGADRANLLYINKGMKDGKLEFIESASSYGLADESYSVQANFFDYDGDGDLDMYLLSNALVDFNRNTPRPKDRTGKAPSADKLFRNNGDLTFTDVSEEANILIEGFGLGVEICDLNVDGWPDVYVSNDFLTDDLLYINQGDGTFVNEIGSYMQHLTFNGMGNDIADINNDGLMDVMVLDMLPPDNKRWKLTMMGNNYDEFQNSIADGYQPQYIRNTLQLNNGNGSFSEVGQLAGISATEWSWSALFADFDHDSHKDLFITNGYRQDITNLDFMVYGNQVLTMGTEEANRKQRLEELNKLPGIKLHNYMFKNKDNLQFEDISNDAGFSKPTYSNGAAYADFDNDGDLDLVINNIDDPAGLYENQTVSNENSNYIRFRLEGEAPNKWGIGSQVELFYDGQLQKQFFTPYRGYLSTVEHVLHFGLGKVIELDSVKVTWPNRKEQVLKGISANQTITLSQHEAKTPIKDRKEAKSTLFQVADGLGLSFMHKEDGFVDFKIQALLPHMHSRNGPGMAVADVNGDGLEDVYIGGAAGQSAVIMMQQANKTFKQVAFGEKEQEDMGAVFFDADLDGDQDLYVVSGGSSFENGSELYLDRFYENDGFGGFSKIDVLPRLPISGSVVTAADYDKDGYMDLFIGGRVRPGEYPLPASSILLKNESANGKIEFRIDEQGINATFDDLGMVTAALWTDFNQDTWQDIIVVGEFMAIRFFQNKAGNFVEVTDKTGLANTNGWWNSIVGGDFDNDGDSDYILGNLGLNSRYKASAEEPLCIYANDYDKNGQIDPVMCYYIDGENHIAHSRNDLIDQINAMRGRFRTYSDYAEATFKESFLEEELSDAYVVKSETFANSYLENLGNGKFRLNELPRLAQIAPMYGITVGDYNQDNYLDVLGVGNFYSVEVFSGRYDASIGWLLEGNGNGSFTPKDVKESGFFVQGDAKSLINVISGDRELTLASINNDSIKTHLRSISEYDIYKPKSDEMAAIIQFKDGTERKIEFDYGSGYLSQGSRILIIPAEAKSIVIIDQFGKQTEIPPM